MIRCDQDGVIDSCDLVLALRRSEQRAALRRRLREAAERDAAARREARRAFFARLRAKLSVTG